VTRTDSRVTSPLESVTSTGSSAGTDTVRSSDAYSSPMPFISSGTCTWTCTTSPCRRTCSCVWSRYALTGGAGAAPGGEHRAARRPHDEVARARHDLDARGPGRVDARLAVWWSKRQSVVPGEGSDRSASRASRRRCAGRRCSWRTSRKGGRLLSWMLVRTEGCRAAACPGKEPPEQDGGRCPAPARRARSGGLTASVPAAESRLMLPRCGPRVGGLSGGGTASTHGESHRQSEPL